MVHVKTLVLLVVISTRCINGQFENLLSLPSEYNAQQEQLDDWEREINNDIWDDIKEENQEIYSPEKLLEQLCEHYDFEIKNQQIQCENVKIVPKNLKINNHVVHKRDIGDDLEGSGDDSPTVDPNEEDTVASSPEPEKQEVQETPVDKVEQPVEPPKESSIEINTKQETSESNTAEIKEEKSEPNTEEKTNVTSAIISENNKSSSENDQHEEEQTTTEVTSVGAQVVSEPALKIHALELPAVEPPKEIPLVEVVKRVEENSTEAQSIEISTKQETSESNAEKEKSEVKIDEAKTDVSGNNDKAEEAAEQKPTESGSGAIEASEAFKKHVLEGELPKEISTVGEVKTIEEHSSEEQPAEPSKDISPVGEVKTVEKAQSVEPPTEISPVGEVTKAEGSISASKDTSEVSKVEEVAKKVEDVPAHEESKKVDESEIPAEKSEKLPIVPETVETKKQEEIITHQSSNAIMNNGKEGMSETDKKLRAMPPNESIKSSVTEVEEPKSGASESQGGRKDTKLLILICGLVAAVGVAAFAYNFIKKRKTRNAAASRAATQANGRQAVNDPEEGREMKPLMKSPQQSNSVEYKDEK